VCGRYRQSRAPGEVAEYFETVNPLPNRAPSWNIAPTQDALVVRRHPETGTRHLDTLRWGLVPPWSKDDRGGAKMINARAETVAEKPAFRDSFLKRRCLVPADGFYEWVVRPEGGKQAYAVGAADGGPMAFAGLWTGWRSPAGEILRTFTIVTTAANATLRPLHERMPVMLRREAWLLWLGEVPAPALELLRLAGPEEPPPLVFWPVSPRVGRVAEDDPGLVGPIDGAALADAKPPA